MQRDAWRTYLELALGLTEASRKKAKKAIKSLVNQSGASVDQVKSLTEELVETSLANREAIAKLVRGELDRALGLVGLASSEEVAELNDRIADLERRLKAADGGTGRADGAATTAAPAADVLSAGRAAVRKAAARKAATTAATSPAKVAAEKATATKAAATRTAAAKKTAAKKTTAKKAVAKKAPAKKAPAQAAPDAPEAGNTQ